MKKILVFGLFETSPGKTVVSTTLCRGILSKGLKVAPFKPRSGHNIWYQHDSYNICIKRESLFSEDIIKLRNAAKCYLPHEILNPVDALMAPLDAGPYISKNTRRMYIDEENTFNNLIVERYTSYEKDSSKHKLCLNKNQINNKFVERSFINKLMNKADEVIEVHNLDGWCSVFQRYGPNSISKCYKKIAETKEVMVVEGFNDAVCPAPELEYDVVIGVGPGISVFYNPTDFQRVIEVLSTMGHNRMTLRSGDVIKYIKPKGMQPIQALKKKYLDDYSFLCEKLQNLIDVTLKQLKK